MKTNQNGILKIAENEAVESTKGGKVKGTRKLTKNWLQY